jgi:hypothetical protein
MAAANSSDTRTPMSYYANPWALDNLAGQFATRWSQRRARGLEVALGEDPEFNFEDHVVAEPHQVVA